MTDTNESLYAERPSRAELLAMSELEGVPPAPVVRSAYNYNRDLVSDQTGLHCEDPSLAVQSQRDEADINTIVRNFGVTKQLPQVLALPQYGDYEGVNDYHAAMNIVRDSERSFMALPSALRAQFDNDPGSFLSFVEDPANAESLASLGISREPGESTFVFQPAQRDADPAPREMPPPADGA